QRKTPRRGSGALYRARYGSRIEQANRRRTRAVRYYLLPEPQEAGIISIDLLSLVRYRLIMESEKPAFRPAQVVSEVAADAAMGSGDPERIRLALIDGSRCLADSWVVPNARKLALHADARVRWAAVFALDQARAGWVPTLRDDFELIILLEKIVARET